MRTRSAFVLLLAVQLIFAGFTAAQAGVISTQRVVDQQLRGERIDRVASLLAQASVRDQLVAYGVDPALAQSRLAGLSDAELVQLERELGEMPAGAGALEVIGIVFVVLLILELVGVIDIFKAR